ncbi:MAG: hypothetical protein DRG78_24600 [Epsilonproteobacteria bacterium]|nr:MAG: hypothetical protein DRG78_24600 [Campylobacterota bacterium]
MIYINSKVDEAKDYLKKQIDRKYSIKYIEDDFFNLKKEFYEKDILILDIDQFNTIENVIEYFNTIPKFLKVIAFSQNLKLAQGTIFIKNGFKSYLGNKTSKLIFAQAIKTVIDGSVWLYPQLMNFIIKNINIDTQNNNSSQFLDKLSAREQNVANFVSQGYSNKDISQKLGIQLVTVKKHIGSIFLKLNVKDRVALAILINS